MLTLGRRFATLIFFATIIACSSSVADFAATPGEIKTDLRLVTLSPHLAELVFAVGAGDMLVGVSEYTDYPLPAAELPIIGDALRVDQERLILLEPDLLLAWNSGNPRHVIDNLRALGFSVELISTNSIDDLPAALRRIGELTGREPQARQVAADFSVHLEVIVAEYAAAEPVRVFYQLDARPLYTINGDHFVSELIQVCGGTNIFSDLNGLAPSVSVEAVLERDPEVIMVSSDAGLAAFDEWDRWKELAANRYGNRFYLPANEISRATPRLLVAARKLCASLDEGRKNRQESKNGAD